MNESQEGFVAKCLSLQVISMPQVNLFQTARELVNCLVRWRNNTGGYRVINTYWSPSKLNVKRAIRIDSVRPLIEGEPTHLAACGIPERGVLHIPGSRSQSSMSGRGALVACLRFPQHRRGCARFRSSIN
jgi:hypothetical protein